jgi:5'(3')-deoxyribonucleotidase
MSESIVLIDCDGVLCDFVGGVIDTLYFHGFGVLPREKLPAHNFVPFIEAELGKEAANFVVEFINSEGFCENLKPFVGAKEVFEVCPDALVVTAPLKTSPYWMTGRADWLVRLGAKRDNILFVPSKYKYLIDGDIFIEDTPGILDEWSSHRDDDWRVFLIDQPYNRDFVSPPWIDRVNLNDVVQFLKEISEHE